MKRIFLTVTVICMCLWASIGLCKTIHVPVDQPTIQAGIDAAEAGDTVLVADGTYTGAGNKNLDFFGKAITVTSENGAENCTIDCEGDGRGFNFHSSEGKDSVVSGFTITNGSVSYNGGGIQCSYSSPTITNNIISWNLSTNGGGICCLESSAPAITNNFIGANGAIQGGGIYCDNTSSPIIANNTITNNLAQLEGGGIISLNESSPAVVINTVLWDDSPQEIVGSVTATYCDVQGGWEGEGNIDTDPLFVAPGENGDYHLSDYSPCIGAGIMTPDVPDTDFDGDPRPNPPGSNPDICGDENPLAAPRPVPTQEWVKYSGNPVLGPGPPGAWDDEAVAYSTVLFNGTEYQMWYSGYPNQRIGHATSADGIVWEKHPNPVLEPGPPGAWDDNHVGAPAVLFNGSEYHMWYQSHDGSYVWKIGYATSADGIVWEKHPNPVLGPGPPGAWDDEYLGSPTVLFNGSEYQMWYSGIEGAYIARTGYATSVDGIVWEKHPDNPVLDLGPPGAWDDKQAGAPAVLFNGTEYHMWYTGNNRLSEISRIGYATSADGIVWVKHPGNPVLDLGAGGTWDDYRVVEPTVLFDGTEYHMWYSGHDGSNMRIGYATSIPIGPTIFNIAPNYGYTIGGTEITITGENFQDDATVTIGGNFATDVTNPIAMPASITSTPIDLTDDADEDAELLITLDEGTGAITDTITFPTGGLSSVQFHVETASDILRIIIQTAIDNTFGTDKITVSVNGPDTAVIVTFTAVAIGSGVRLTIEQLAGSDILFPAPITSFGGLTIHATTPAGNFGPTDVVVINPDGGTGILRNGFFYIHITGDVSGDGTVSAYDAALILQFVVGIIEQFPADSPISQAAQKYIAGEITIE
ncbi:IPT/TIG domain-containing protein, partial [bacterium]|nr:IPT/TIG domain-containing protein [bacterium]